ncbi:MAG TPA: hypothetical protein VJN88_12170 [Ktedonobacterales bacterium]|nr:hypothetical protein [Ktedonobacterales bacterium]
MGQGRNGDQAGASEQDFEQIARALPPPDTAEYWQRIEQPRPGAELPLEVLVRCCRQPDARGQRAQRVYTALLPRIQRQTQAWAHKIARMSHSGQITQLAEDLEQECYVMLWQELTRAGDTFLAENFQHKLHFIQKHVAHDRMEKDGEWRRRGVAEPTRPPRANVDSVERLTTADETGAHPQQFTDPAALDAFSLAELTLDMDEQLAALDPGQRAVLYDAYWRDTPRIEIADKLGITDRALRMRMEKLLKTLRGRMTPWGGSQ